jgi:superfamily II DNA or RNA helicase
MKECNPFLSNYIYKGMLSRTEIQETKAQSLPSANLDALKSMRDEACHSSLQADFKLQTHQRFLRRVLSPDSPVRNLLMVHGTGTGKTCTAIQIAEEFILRPEFQEKRVLIMANPSIQDSFKSQIFDVSKASVDAEGIISSKQCTGKRYLEMIQRAQREPLKLTDKSVQNRVMEIASRLIGEFYEFQGYESFSNLILDKTEHELDAYIHKTFDNRLIIIDEAHNIRQKEEGGKPKLVASALEKVIKVANGVTLILLTATPMYDTYDEVLFYFNLFLWNDRRIDTKRVLKPTDYFKDDQVKADKESEFRSWCQDYVSFIRGENPFTFPFRLPPPAELVAKTDRKTDISGNTINKHRKFLTLTESILSPNQAAVLQGVKDKKSSIIDSRVICVYPQNKSFSESFSVSEGKYVYRTDNFLAPSKVQNYSSKFALITKILEKSEGIAFVYSNLVEDGANLFSMCLEEHGYVSALGNDLLKETSGEIARGSRGRYLLFTSDVSNSDIRKAITRLKNPNNRDGSDIRVIVSSPKISEGVDFRYIRQIHILDPWFNMRRIEQVVGRGMRTCSHSLLPFEKQNCTVYFHICRYADSDRETYDEYIYRVFVEEKGEKIAKVKQLMMESAMDCSLNEATNSLPKDWREDLKIPQIRSQDGEKLHLSLTQMSAPTFELEAKSLACSITAQDPDPQHVRPLSAILDVREEIFDKLATLFEKKSIWSKDDLFEHSLMKQYDHSVLSYTIQTAISNSVKFHDKLGRTAVLESKGDMLALSVNDSRTMLDRILKSEAPVFTPLEKHVRVATTDIETNLIEKKRKAYGFPEYIEKEFTDDVLNWYIIDHTLSEEDRLSYMLKLDWTNPPIYAQPLKITIEDGKKLYVLGLNKVFNELQELTTPIGKEKQEYDKWTDALKKKFVDNKSSFFATMKDGKILFNIDETSDELKVVQRSKGIGGRACTSYKESILNEFANWLGVPFTEVIKGKKDRCMFLDLLIRKMVINNKPDLLWLTPEEWEILNDEKKHVKGLIKNR